MNSTRPEVKDSLVFDRQSSWLEDPFDVVWSTGSLFTLFAHHQIGRVKARTDTQIAMSEDRGPRRKTSRIDDFDAQAHDAPGELTTR
jgi:hypothetical protein